MINILMKNKIKLLFTIVLLSSKAMAQTTENRCPPSTRNDIHIVQRGETLSIIAKQHNLTLDELCKLNGLTIDAMIRHCAVLKLVEGADVSSVELKPKKIKERESVKEYDMQIPKKDSTSKTKLVVRPKITKMDTLPFAKYEKQEGKKHIVQPGQTMRNLSRLYGYREERFRTFNSLPKGEPKIGATLLSSDCACEAVSPSALIATSEAVEKEATVDTPTPKPAEAEVKAEEVRVVDIEKVELPAFPEKEVAKEPTLEDALAITKVDTVVKLKAEEPYEDFEVVELPTMMEEELAMVAEINLLRDDPAGYVKYVEEYLEDLEFKGQKKGSVEKSAKSLIKQLKKTPKLSVLEGRDCLYESARKHGQEAMELGKLGHQGKDGAWPWDRIRKNCKTLKDGNENIVVGYESARRAVVILLIDDGIEGFGHRQALLKPEWRYVACYKVGTVGKMNNCWIQDFAF